MDKWIVLVDPALYVYENNLTFDNVYKQLNLQIDRNELR